MANYYNEKIISKFNEALKEAKEEVKAGSITEVSISRGNIKMGSIPSVSLMPFLTCPAICKDTCGKICYAAKMANLRASVLKSYARNTALLMLKPDLYWTGVEYAVMRSTYFRFHVSGDIPRADYFAKVADIAIRNRHCQILMFTKRYDIVNDWISENGDLPDNLHVLFSAWDGLQPDNPYNLPETNVYSKGEEPDLSWLLCGGNCFECVCRGLGCWQAKKGDVIAFEKH